MDQVNQLWAYFYKPPPCPSLGLADNIPGLHAAVADAIDLCYLDGWKDCGVFVAVCGVAAFIVYVLLSRRDIRNP